MKVFVWEELHLEFENLRSNYLTTNRGGRLP